MVIWIVYVAFLECLEIIEQISQKNWVNWELQKNSNKKNIHKYLTLKAQLIFKNLLNKNKKDIYGILKIYVEEGVYICKYLHLDDIYVIINL